MNETSNANALIHETSPYLLQHAYNPVQWYPWGDEALDRARAEDKPILLSIGYSACHWCHVMAHESFENDAIAALMNELYINIKVDREERPDLDKIYQTAQQLLTRRGGGWPLTMFLAPEDRVPFFGGTYFPPAARHGLPGFPDVLRQVAAFYHQERETVTSYKSSLLDAFERIQAVSALEDGAQPDSGLLNVGAHELVQSFDRHYGGFGGAPKFPTPANLVRLLHHYQLLTPEPRLLEIVTLTLQRMAEGGLYDQVGGGFCRYSVDERWMIPHFEKMLYDNALLLALYSDAWHLTSDPLFRATASGTADWMIREMQSPGGGIYSSLDADSESEEGKYYVWTPDQVRALLDEREYELFSFHTGLDRSPNFEGRWHLHVNHTAAEVAQRFSMEPAQTADILESARGKLYRGREQRIRPGCDDKILTSWNGLAIRGLAVAAGRLGRPDYLAAAERALGFIQRHLWRDDRLLATCKDGRSHLNAYLDDYACLLDAVLQILQERWSAENLNFAIRLADRLLELFEDAELGGFYFTSHDHETLIQRRKDFMDDAVPSGNGIAARTLARLGHLIHEPRYTTAAERTLRAAWGAMEQMPSAHNSLLFVLEDLCFPPRQIILRGDETMEDWRRACRSAADTRTMVFAIPAGAEDLPDILGERAATAPVTAYICEGFSCLAPVTSLPELANHLKRESSMG